MMKIKKKKCLAMFTAAMFTAALLAGCGSGKSAPGDAEGAARTGSDVQQETARQSSDAADSGAGASADAAGVTVRVGSLKGPTSMGLLFLKEKAAAGEAEGTYAFQMTTAADELLPLMAKGDLDIALIPANVAAVLYQKMQGGLAVIDINTLGVLHLVSGDASVKTPEDLKGRTVYLTGKGTVPEYVLRYILDGNGLKEGDYSLEYKSEPAEVAALLADDPAAVGLLPQPFVTAASVQNEALTAVMDMNEEWEKLRGGDGSRIITGVTVVRRAFLEEHEEAVKLFLKEHEASALALAADVKKGALLTVEEGIIAKAPIAEKAIPKCNVTFIQGSEMREALEGYLKVLFEQEPQALGGSMPEDDFYYMAQ